MNILPRFLPWMVVTLAGIYLIVVMVPSRDPADQMQIEEAGRLVVVNGGRYQPLDTYARTQMMLMNKRQAYTDGLGSLQPAIRWLLDTMAAGLSGYYQRFQFVGIDDPKMVEFLGLDANPRNLYAIQDIIAKPQFKQTLDRILKQEPKQNNDFDKKLLALALQMAQRAERVKVGQAIDQELERRKTEKAPLFRIENDQVLAMLKLPMRSGLRYSWSEVRDAKGLEQFERKAKEASKRPDKEWDVIDGKAVELYRNLQAYREVEMLGGALLVPPPTGDPSADWSPLNQALVQADVTGADNPAAGALEDLIRAYGTGDVKGFNQQLAAYRQMQEQRYPSECRKAQFEVFFNHFAPFFQCMVLYFLAAALVCLSWIFWCFSGVVWREALNRTAFWLLAFTFVVHTLALIARMYLQGRPPVTNLYSSAVFIGWGAVGLGLFLEFIFRLSVGNLIGAALGFLTTVISHHLALSGDTLEMMQAVLDTNFWLATHVTCVTLGYTATFVAGFIGILYVVLGLCTPWLNRKVSQFTLTTVAEVAMGPVGYAASFFLDRTLGKALIQMLYGVICFATLLSFVGTVLGGVWADQSWGRFWGWDPKENGALLIVAMNALILHARWAGMIKDRGMAVLAMCGNMITLWSWFGTNQLGIGLHSYGVNKTLVEVCRLGWVFQGMLIFAALVPTRYWWSFQAEPSQQRPAGRRHRNASS